MIETVLIGFLLLLLPPVLWIVAKQLYSHYRRCRAVKNIPGFPTHWLWGNLHQVRINEAFMNELSDLVFTNRYKITRGWVGPFLPRVTVYHSELVRKVLKEPKDDNLYSML